MYTRMFIHIHAHTYIHTNMHTYICVYIYICIYVLTYTHTYTYIHTYVRTYVRTYIRTRIRAYIISPKALPRQFLRQLQCYQCRVNRNPLLCTLCHDSYESMRLWGYEAAMRLQNLALDRAGQAPHVEQHVGSGLAAPGKWAAERAYHMHMHIMTDVCM